MIQLFFGRKQCLYNTYAALLVYKQEELSNVRFNADTMKYQPSKQSVFWLSKVLPLGEL